MPSVSRRSENHEHLYKLAVEMWDAYLAADDGAAACMMLRDLMERVVVYGGDNRGGKRRPMRLHGALYRLLGYGAAEDNTT